MEVVRKGKLVTIKSPEPTVKSLYYKVLEIDKRIKAIEERLGIKEVKSNGSNS